MRKRNISKEKVSQAVKHLVPITLWSTSQINEPVTAAPAGGAGRSAEQRTTKLQSISESPPARSLSLDISHTCNPTSPLLSCTLRPSLHSFARLFVSQQFWVWSATFKWFFFFLDAFKDAGLYGDDHYVPAVGQTEAPSVSAATAAAAQRRTRACYL